MDIQQFRNSERFALRPSDVPKPLYLLTGATGLVGRYLLAGLLRRGCCVAALVRSSHRVAASVRVEEALEPFEDECLLPRPWVIDSDLNKVGLGVSVQDLAFLQQFDVRVIHCAASIRFVQDTETGEPYATNVGGTDNLLQLCKRLRIVDFHHVSTAYVGARLKTNPIPEDWCMDEQIAGNDYERSKIRAECMVRNCPWLPARTIHRPSIVVGDSKTDYTSTFHGFYAPLQIGCQFARAFGFSKEAGDWFRGQLGLSEQDSKNLVPVDWVAENIVRVATASVVKSNRILHWTNPEAVPCRTMQTAIVDAIAAKYATGNTTSTHNSHPNPELFREQMQVYESYFSDDPNFDSSNAQSLVINPCPKIDGEKLRSLAEFAIRNNFGWPRKQPKTPANTSLRSALMSIPNSESQPPSWKQPEIALQLNLLGPGAPAPLLFGFINGSWRRLPASQAATAITVTIRLTELQNLLENETTLETSLRSGQCVVVGSQNAVSHMELWLRSLQHLTSS